MDPIEVVVRRGNVVEAVHRVHAVAVQGGAVVAEAGDGALVTYFRSSAKPFQALPLVRERADLDERDLAIASASHQAEPAQLDAVRALLAKAPADVDELECGFDPGRPCDRLHHNCSGKHAGMLALCRARDWPAEGYRLAEHPLQQLLLEEVAAAAEADPREIARAVDGCGVQTFALPLERMAFAFARLERLEGGARVAAAMRAHPDLVGGDGADDTALMRARPGFLAKRGAEGLFCAVGPRGLGLAVKVEDGASRALRPALARLFALLGDELPEFAEIPLRNSRDEVVGRLEAR